MIDRTPWFSCDTQPVRVGWYEVVYWANGQQRYCDPLMRYWDGRLWTFGPREGRADIGAHHEDLWRGEWRK